MKLIGGLVSLATYAYFFYVFLGLLFFIEGKSFLQGVRFGLFDGLFPHRIDHTSAARIGADTLFNNSFWFIVFVVQHSIMARPWFKEIVTKVVPSSLERSLFVLCASFPLQMLVQTWIPLNEFVVPVPPVVRQGFLVISMIGWTILLAATFNIDHFHLFGLRQGFTGSTELPGDWVSSGLYSLVRHPIMLGFLVGFYFAPPLTAGSLLLDALATAYIFGIGLPLEEGDLRRAHPAYAKYEKKVPNAVCPFF
jgi:protein-S-isoprenylcysteine O-methyltransferase Ste14